MPTADGRRRGGSGWLEGRDARRRLDLEGGEDGALRLGQPRRLLDGAGLALEGDELQALQLGGDPPPALAGSAFGDPDQQEGKPADDDVGASCAHVSGGASTQTWLYEAESEPETALTCLRTAELGIEGGGQWSAGPQGAEIPGSRSRSRRLWS